MISAWQLLARLAESFIEFVSLSPFHLRKVSVPEQVIGDEVGGE